MPSRSFRLSTSHLLKWGAFVIETEGDKTWVLLGLPENGPAWIGAAGVSSQELRQWHIGFGVRFS